MSPTTTWTHRWASTALALLLWSPTIAAAPSIPLTYCASVNTASTNANHSIYQSDGLCHDFCKDGSYPLAIVQDDTCWCSSKVPDKKAQVSLSQCSTPCPGFPDDLCGGNGLYGYVVVDGVPGSKPTVPGGPGQSSGPTPPPTPTVQTVTAGGTVMTVTVTPTSGVNSPNQAAVTSQNSGGLGVGASVGIAIGVIAAAVLAAVAAFCVWRRRKQRQDEGKGIFHTPSPRGSSAGMTGSPKVAEKSTTPPFLSRNPDGTYESDHSGRRRSFLMPIDPRIDPAHTAIYNRDGNKSHESVNTLRDDQDYSRRVHQPKVLRATNPDPDDD